MKKLTMAILIGLFQCTSFANQCSDKEFEIFKYYDSILEKHQNISEDTLRNTVAQKYKMRPSALKNLYFKCLFRWREEAFIENSSPTNGSEDTSSTKNQPCRVLGYRYGHTAARAMQGKSVITDWNFSMPSRCRNSPETNEGIKDGTIAGQR